jgi:hypothetical protein
MTDVNEEQNRTKATQSNQGTGLGLGGFSMTAISATESQDASEIGRRSVRTFGWIIAVIIIVGGLAWWFTQGVNQFWKPNAEDTNFLLSLQKTNAVQNGIIKDFNYKNRLTITSQVNPSLATNIASADREKKADASMTLRSALKELVIAFSNRRPNEEVNIMVLNGEEEVAHASFMPASTTAQKPEELDKQIYIHIEGEGMDSGAAGTGDHGGE